LNVQSLPLQFVDLLFIQLTNWRWSWRGMLLAGTVAPVVSTIGLGIFAADRGPTALGYVLVGNVVLSLLFGTVGKVGNNFVYMRVMGMLDYFSTLPTYRVILVLATVAAFLLLSLPSVLVTLIGGSLILRLPLTINPLVLLVLPLISVTLCGLGAVLGILGRTIEEVNVMSTLITFLMMGLGPVVIEPDRLPNFVNTLSYLSPATYAASALRQLTLGLPDRIPLGVDIAVLTAIMVVLLWFVSERMDWRGRD
jgi:ABC-2 type transport system permease protein